MRAEPQAAPSLTASPIRQLATAAALYQWEGVPRTVLAAWQSEQCANTAVQQSAGYVDALAAAVGRDRIHVAVCAGLLSAFQVHVDRATCVFVGEPALGGPLDGALAELADLVWTALAVPVVHFQHVGADAARRAAADGFAVWQRLPSPVVDWTDGGGALPERVRRRYGSRADRQWHRFESGELVIGTATGQAAVNALDSIECRSWKAACGQSMHDRDRQFELYSGLIERGLVTLDVVYHDNRPVAYRLDAQTGRTVACVKWSFDEQYRRFSPGFYLLTKGLVRRWQSTSLDHVDLFGSPDTLKGLVQTETRDRFDLAWPPNPAAASIRDERQAHDSLARKNHAAGQSVRRLYMEQK